MSWGKGAENNSIGWGQGDNNSIGWGLRHLDSWSGDTALYGVYTNPEVLSWQNSIIAQGGSVDATTINAANDFITSISAFRSKIVRLNFFASDSLAGALVPLINSTDGVTVIGNAVDTNNNFVSGDYGKTTGLGNAANSSKFIGTGIVPSSTSAITNAGLGIGVWSLTDAADVFDMGAWGDGVAMFYICAKLSSSLRSVLDSVVSTQGVSDGLGFSAWSQINSTQRVLQKNGTSYTKADGGITTPKTTKQIRVFNVEGVGYSPRKMAGYFVSNGLTASEMTDLYNAWSAFNTAIGR